MEGLGVGIVFLSSCGIISSCVRCVPIYNVFVSSFINNLFFFAIMSSFSYFSISSKPFKVVSSGDEECFVPLPCFLSFKSFILPSKRKALIL